MEGKDRINVNRIEKKKKNPIVGGGAYSYDRPG